MRAKKSLGQHFLTNPQITQKIAGSLLQMEDIDWIVEVGPGRGILTKELIDRPEQLLLIEKDGTLVTHLQKEYPHLSDRILEHDFLKADLDRAVPAAFHLIGNFPYNISSQIIFKMLDNRPLIPQMVGMFQKEVAMRLASGHGSKQYGILSVLLQTFYDVEVLFSLGPGAFTPPPKVKSTVIRCIRKAGVTMSLKQEKLFRKVVKHAFGQRRKMFRNSLAPLLTEENSTSIQPFLTLRPEQVSIEEFRKLSELMAGSE